MNQSCDCNSTNHSHGYEQQRKAKGEKQQPHIHESSRHCQIKVVQVDPGDWDHRSQKPLERYTATSCQGPLIH